MPYSRRSGRAPPQDRDRNEHKTVTEKKDIRYCPYCGMGSFELSADEEGLVYCEYCGIDVEVKELIP